MRFEIVKASFVNTPALLLQSSEDKQALYPLSSLRLHDTTWEIASGGERVTPPNVPLNADSPIGSLVARVVKDLDLLKFISGRGEPSEAKAWIGLIFNMEWEEKATGLLMPVKFVGVRGPIEE